METDETDKKPQNHSWDDESAFDLVRKPKDEGSLHDYQHQGSPLTQTASGAVHKNYDDYAQDAQDDSADDEYADDEREKTSVDDETTDEVIISSVSQPISQQPPAATEEVADPVDPKNEQERDTKTTRNFVIAIGLLLLLLAAVFASRFFFGEQNVTGHVVTIDDLHQQNVVEKLNPKEGYMYNGFSFVKFNDVWNTQLAKGNTIYDLTFNNDPKSTENVSITGKLDPDYFKDKNVFITFDPLGKDLKHVAVANYGFSRSLAVAFDYNLSAGCTREDNCAGYPIYTCDDEDKSVVYFKEANETAIVYDDNCVIVQGKGSELVRAKDRLLMRWYGIMD
ncbi:hypothetical protein HY772_02625 [Candidatus Woesearchaeota archaeon]|nr:hypothetical protein [Candidatus Woesearchaeota archaeon]